MLKFQIPAVPVDAVQFNPNDIDALVQNPIPGIAVYVAGPYHANKAPGEFLFATLETADGYHRLSTGDWIVTLPDGARKIVPDAVFIQTYEPTPVFDQTTDPEVEHVFAEFWAPIVAPTGTLDIAAVKRELYDYRTAIEEVGEAYMELTGGRFSKPNTVAGHVIDAANELTERAIAEALAEAGKPTELAEWDEAGMSDTRHPWTVALEEGAAAEAGAMNIAD